MVQNQQLTVSYLLGLASIGIGIIAFLSPSLRVAALIALIVVLFFSFVIFKFLQEAEKMERIMVLEKKLERNLKTIHERFDLYKKLYNLESAVSRMEKKMGKKGKFDPIWGMVALILLIFLFFVLKAAGLF